MAHYSYGPLRKEPGRARASWWLGATRLWSACFRKRRRRNVVSSEERTQLFDRRLKAFASSPSIDMQVSRWRNVFSLKSYVIPSTIAPTNFSAFHSTPCCFEKWKNKWNSHIKGGQQPSKSYVKYVIRQKRADAKKALKNLLYRSGSSKFPLEDVETWKLEGDQDYDSDGCYNKRQTKSRQRSGKSQKRAKRKIKRETFCEDFDFDSETTFQATFGNKSYSWSFRNSWGSSYENSTSGFEWREHSHSDWTNSRNRRWRKSASDVESDDDDSCCVGSSSDRTILGLPPTGPLKIEDVKNAFRLSALKWHPDKHQGPSQAVAEEKFKVCVNAYKSLCNVLSPA